MADAEPVSFAKTIDIRDAESTTTTNETVTVAGVLTTDNTAAFTPTGDYNPATKLYVDGVGTGDVINVMTYGAVGDGVTDDGQAAQDAMDAAVAGDTVYFPAGSYLFDTFHVAIKSGVKVMGAGIGATTILRGDTILYQPCFLVSTYVQSNGAGHTGYVGDKENIEICNLTIDFNFLASGWVGGAALLRINANSTNGIHNLNIHHIHFTDNDPTVDPTGDPDETLDVWAIANYPYGEGNKNFHITDCICDAPYHQFLGGGQGNIDGFWIERNYVYHARDNGISVMANDNSVGDSKNIHIIDNVIIGFALHGIVIGTDGTTAAYNGMTKGVTIRGNTIIADSYKEGVVSDVYQTAIGAFASAGGGLDGLTIADNVIIQQSDSTAAMFYGIYLSTYVGPDTLTLSGTFVQPAEDTTVGSITFTTSPGLAVGSILHIGDAGEPGGRYEVTINASEDYTLKRLSWATSTTTGGTVPVTALLIGEVKNTTVTGNTIAGRTRMEWCNNVKFSDNVLSGSGLAYSLYLLNCNDMDIKDNVINDGDAWMLYSNSGRFTGNVFGQASSDAGWIRQKSNADALSRITHNEWYMEGNIGKAELTAANHVTTDQTTSGTGTHSLSGSSRSGRTPESYLTAEIGATCLDVTTGTMYVKKIGTGDTGWQPEGTMLSTDGSNYVSISHNNTDAQFKTDNGYFTFLTQETGVTTTIKLQGEGAGFGRMFLFDQDNAEYTNLSCVSGYTHLETVGTSPNGIHLEYNAEGNVELFAGAGDGETQALKIYGYRTSDSIRVMTVSVGVDAVNTVTFGDMANYRFDGNVNAVGGFSDNGTAGIDTTFVDADGNTITVSGGIITAKTAP